MVMLLRCSLLAHLGYAGYVRRVSGQFDVPRPDTVCLPTPGPGHNPGNPYRTLIPDRDYLMDEVKMVDSDDSDGSDEADEADDIYVG